MAGSKRVGVLGLAEERVALGVEADRGEGRPVQELDEAVAVHAVVGGLAHPDVAPRRVGLVHVQHPRPDVRVDAGHHLEARLLEARHRVGRRHLDPVDLARAQRGQARGRLGHRGQQHLVDLRDLVLVPVGGVLRQLDAHARLHLGDLEGAGARGRLGELRPRRAGLLELGRARDQRVGDDVGEVARRATRGDLDGEVVDLPPRLEQRIARPRDGAALRLELLGLRVVEALEVPDHRVRVEVGAVVELDAAAQREDPLGRVGLVLRPLLREPGPEPGQRVRAGQVPQREALEDRVAEEAHALEAIVRHARGRGDVGGRHGDAQRAAALGRGRLVREREARRRQDRGDEGAEAAAARWPLARGRRCTTRGRDVEQGVWQMVHVCASLAHG